MYDAIVIGAGCAGLTASIYVYRAGLKVLVIEKSIYGGQISVTDEVENYPGIDKISGSELSMKIYNQVKALGIDIIFEEVVNIELNSEIKIIKTNKKDYNTKTVIIANGVQRRKLECKGEEEFTNKGVSYCATCDGAFFRNKIVAVVGGGNTALEDALFLANLCKKVYLIHRRNEFRADDILSKAVKANEKIEILYNNVVTEICGSESVESIKVSDKNNEKIIEVSAVFIAIGLVPDNRIFDKIINIDDNGYIISDENCKTNIEGVYVAGDTRTKLLRQIITAASDGAIAGFQAANFINRK